MYISKIAEIIDKIIRKNMNLKKTNIKKNLENFYKKLALYMLMQKPKSLLHFLRYSMIREFNNYRI